MGSDVAQHMDHPVDLCLWEAFYSGERTDIMVMVTSRREGFHGLQTKVTSDGGEAERLKSSLFGFPATCGVTQRGAKK